VGLALVAVRAAEPPSLPVAPTDPSPPAARGKPAEVPPAAVPLPPAPADELRPLLKDALSRRAYLERVADPEPFDLSFLARDPAEVQAVVAVRPAALLGHPDLRGLAPAADALAAHATRLLGFAADGPGLAGIEWLMLPGHCGIAPNTDEGTKEATPIQFELGGESLVIRTVAPFDWAAYLRRSFADCATVEHRGDWYLATWFDVPAFHLLAALCKVWGCAGLKAFYVPDDRTLVIDNESVIRRLIERRKAGQNVSRPPGWDRVARAAVAVSLDTRDRRWLDVAPRWDGPSPPPALDGFTRYVDRLTVGVELGPVSRVRVIAAGPDPAAGRRARDAAPDALREVATRVTDGADHEAGPDVVFDAVVWHLLADGTLTPTALGFEYVSECPCDLLRTVHRYADRWHRLTAAREMLRQAGSTAKPGHGELPPVPAPPPKKADAGAEFWKSLPPTVSIDHKP
ncbi:MAG: hypothetical protein K2X82_33825, partial [Gemmataceae bacterium]|nr:hypothetical protein [Gemmataceae bacterium]